MPKKISDKWSIQISGKTANALKEYCNDNGLKMNWFIETAVHLCISGSFIVTHINISGSYGK